MKSKVLRLALMSGATLCFFAGCASRAHLAPHSNLLVVVSPGAQAASCRGASPQNDSGTAGQSLGLEAIDSLIQNADMACDSENWAAACTLLRQAVSNLHGLEEMGDGVESEEYYTRIASVYSDRMPETYADSVPDEVSLLAFQKQINESLDSITISGADSIALQAMIDRKKADYNIPIVWNDRVYKALCFLSRGGKGPLDKWIARSNYYLPTIKRLFSDSGVPTDIAYLPLIESGFNPLAYSRKKAAGMWQFIPSTGKLYGLRKDCWVDQRRDFIESTKAAISYFKKLYNQFGDWHIAIASYNCGENSMCRAMARSSVKNYWALSKLPKETRHYIPEFLAALIVAKNPNYAGASTAASDTFDLDTITVERCLSLHAIADSLGISYHDLRQKNPHLLHWCTHPNAQVTIYLPKGKKESFQALYDSGAEGLTVDWYSYQIKHGETLKSIARHFKVSVEALCSLNEMPLSRRLSVGTELFIPIPVNQTASPDAVIGEREERPKPSYKTAIINGARVIKYRVRSGDCLWGISQLFRVDKRDLCAWNNLDASGRLRAGTVLTLYKSPESLKMMVSSSTDDEAQAPAPKKTASTEAVRIDSTVNNQTTAMGSAPDADAKRIVYYKVRKGDNLWNIAQSFKVAVGELTAMNDIDLDTTLFPGLVLKVPLSRKL